MAPEPAVNDAPPNKGNGDYSTWSWAEIQTAINAGDAQTLHDTGTAFETTKTDMDDFVKKAKNDADELTGPDGTWKGPAAQAFNGLMGELLTTVQNYSTVLTPYKGALDTAGNSLTTAQNDVKTAISTAAQQTIDRYNNELAAYGTAVLTNVASLNIFGPLPPYPGPAPYSTDATGQTTADVSHYPEILEALNERMRTIIDGLAGNYVGSINQATAPENKPLPNPFDQPPPVLNDKGADVFDPPADNGPAKIPPQDLPQIAQGNGDLNAVTKPGGLKDLKGAVPPPDLAKFNAKLDGPQVAGPNGFNGVLGAPPPPNLLAPGDKSLNNLVPATDAPAVGAPAPGGHPTGDPLLGGAPVGFAALTPPPERLLSGNNKSGVIGGPETNAENDLLAPNGHVTGAASSGVIGRGVGEPGAFGGVPPMMAGGYGGMMVDPEMEGAMFREDVFGESEEVGRDRKFVSGPENETVVPGEYPPGDERERERKNRYTTESDDMWGSGSSASSY